MEGKLESDSENEDTLSLGQKENMFYEFNKDFNSKIVMKSR